MYRARTLATTALSVLIALTTVALSHAAEMTVQWTAPGDDGYVGRAAAYDLRYSRQPLTEDIFALADVVTGVPVPGQPGETQSCTVTGLEVGVTYYFAIKAVDETGNWSAMSNVLRGEIHEIARGPAELPLSFSAPRPNPAREQTSFHLTLPSAAPVHVEVFDVTGRQVRQLVRSDFGAGPVELGFDLRDDAGVRLARGVYLVRARVGTAVFTRRLIVVK